MVYTLAQSNDESQYVIKRYDTYHSFSYSISTDSPFVLDPSEYTIHVSLIGYKDNDSIIATPVSAYGDFTFKLDDQHYMEITDGVYNVYAWMEGSSSNIVPIPSSLTIRVVEGCYVRHIDI